MSLLQMAQNNEVSPEALLSKIENTDTVPFQRFVLKTQSYGTDHIYCFVEGYDLPYYNIRIEMMSGKKCAFIDSGGKKNVIAVNELIRQRKEYSSYKILYMIDRDYDDNSNVNDSVYITPCYSIENFYGSIDCFKKLIVGTYHVYEDNPKYNLCIELYNRLSDSFIKASSCFCAWYRCTKRKVNHEVELKESFPEKYASFTSNSIVTTNYDLTVLNSDYPNVDNVTTDELNESLDYIDNNINNIRGKYVMQFIEFIIQLLNRDSKTNKKYTESKVEFEQNRKTLITRLSAYADTPICLRNYVMNHAV
jgi:hypothetical protein